MYAKMNEKKYFSFVALAMILFICLSSCKNAKTSGGSATGEGEEQSEDSEVVDGAVVQLSKLKDDKGNWIEPLWTDDKLVYAIRDIEERILSIDGGSKDLQNLDIPAYAIIEGDKYRVQSISANAFANHPSLREVTIPASIHLVGYGAFAGSHIVSASLSCSHIFTKAFYGCTSLNNLFMDEGVEFIADEAFKGCESLRNLVCPQSLESIGTCAFKYAPLESIDLGGVRVLQKEAFEGSYLIKDVKLGPNLETIGPRAFAGCWHIESITFPESLQLIDLSAFSDCSGLTTVVLPEGLKTLKSGAFSRCKHLQSVVLPESIDSLESSTFSECIELKSVTLPSHLKRIPKWCFTNCKSLEEIEIPTGVTVIAEDAFSDSGLKSLTLPEGVVRVETRAFKCCPFTELRLPSTIEVIDYLAFLDCTSLTDIYCLAKDVPETARAAFHFVKNPLSAILHVPSSSVEAYRSTEPWDDFKTIEPIDD